MNPGNRLKLCVVLVMIFLMTGGLPISCGCLNSCGCFYSGNDVKDFSIDEFGMETTDANLQSRDTAQYHSYADLFKAFYVSKKTDIAWHSAPAGLFTSAAMACSPREPRAIQNFASIRITARNTTTYQDVADAINAGDDISDRFELGFAYGSRRAIQDFINDQFPIPFAQRFMLRLVDPPHQPTVLHFDVVIETSDSQIFTRENEIMKVLN